MTPLDLQMLISQVDKVAKDVQANNAGAQLHKSIEAAAKQKINEEKSQTVRETQDDGQGPEKLAGDERGSGGGQQKQKRRNEDNDEAVKRPKPALDTNLGRYVDLSG
ncbi:MAG: hypothetical protein LBC77_06760 [Spirochaetaceae bacterium]|nr:hypothetical protein [Spirochaetaceae bacterium]